MNSNLILYETHYGCAKKTAEIFSLILGYAKIYDIKDFSGDIKNYGRLIFVFGFHGNDTAEKIINYVAASKEAIKDKEILLIGVGLEKNDLVSYVKIITDKMEKEADYIDFVHGEIRVEKLTPTDKSLLESFFEKHNIILSDMGKFKASEACDIAEKYYYIIKNQGEKIEKEELTKICYKYLSEHNTCALCTGTQDFVRATPLEYLVKDKDLFIMTEGGMKFYGILQNKNVCIAIFESYKGMGKLRGMQITGTAERVEPFSEEYNDIIRQRNLKIEMVKSLPVRMNIIKIKVSKIEYLNSDFKKKGYDNSQVLYLK